MFKSKVKFLLTMLISMLTVIICSVSAAAYGEVSEATTYYVVKDGFVYDQYNTQLYTTNDERWQSWIEALHTEVIRDTLTGADSWFEKGGTGGTVVLTKWGQLLCDLSNLNAKDGYYEFDVNETNRVFKLTEETVQWLKNDLCNDLKQAINEGFVPYTYNVYVPFTSELTGVKELNLTECETEFSYTMHPILGEVDSLYINDISSVYVLNLGGKYGVTINDKYIHNIKDLVDKSIFVPREDIQAVGVTYVKDGGDKSLSATACVTAWIPLKAPYTQSILSDVYVDIVKKSLVNNSQPTGLAAIGLDLENFYTIQGYAYSNKYKEVITNGVNTLPTGDFLTLSDVINVGTISAIKNEAYPVDYILNANKTVDVVVNAYGLCIIIPSANINFEKLVVSLGTEEVIQNLGEGVKNGSVFELAKSIYQGLGGDKATWESYMVTAGFKEPEGFNFGIIIVIVVILGVGVGVFFIVKKVRKTIQERKEIENSYTNILTGNTTKIAKQEEDDKVDTKKAEKEGKKVDKKSKNKEKSDTKGTKDVIKKDEKEEAKTEEKVEEVEETEDNTEVVDETTDVEETEETEEMVEEVEETEENEEKVEEVEENEEKVEEVEETTETTEDAVEEVENNTVTEPVEEVKVEEKKAKRGRPRKVVTEGEATETKKVSTKKTVKKVEDVEKPKTTRRTSKKSDDTKG